MNPKFSIGEIVIVQSPYYPETNGEYEVLDIFTHEVYREYCNRQFKAASGDTLIYKLENYIAVGKHNPEHTTDCVSEPSLRKKHQPGEFSFISLMDNLKLPQKA